MHKISEGPWFLKVYNFVTEKSRTLAEMPSGTEDFVLSEDDHVLCANNSKLLKLSKDNRWQIVIDLKPLNIVNINRLAISKNLMAIVSVLKP